MVSEARWAYSKGHEPCKTLACIIKGTCGSFNYRLSVIITGGLEVSNWETVLIGTSGSALDVTGMIPLYRLWFARGHESSQRIRPAIEGRS